MAFYQEFTLATNEVIKGTETGEAIYYYVVLEYPNLDESQNIDMGGSFEGKVTVKKDFNKFIIINTKPIFCYSYILTTNTHTFTGLTANTNHTINVVSVTDVVRLSIIGLVVSGVVTLLVDVSD